MLKIWRIRNLTAQGKITILKTLTISKVIHLGLVTNIPQVIIDQLNKIQKYFIWYRKHPRHSTLCNSHENGGHTTTHCRKIIPTFLIRKN